MYVHIDGAFTNGTPETLKNIREMIKLKFNIQESRNVKKFLGMYYEWSHDAKDTYAKISMEKDVKKLVDGYDKFIGSDVKFQKIPGVSGTNLSKSEL